MRAFRVGFILLLTLLPSWPVLGADVDGFVEQVGFNRVYRPECWVPMLVNLTSRLSETAEFDLIVEQEDLDSDTVVYRRRVVLNAGRQDKFWVYFQPRTTKGSLPVNAQDLANVLRVSLTKPGGGGTPIPVSLTGIQADNIDARQSNRGAKLVLAVTDQGGTIPGAMEYGGALGLIEDVIIQRLGTADLPENELGYDSVDAILWLNADAKDLEAGGSRKMAALERWVRQGGHLVVCQPIERGRIELLGPLLPVETKRGTDWVLELRDRSKPQPLQALTNPGGDRTRPEEDLWSRARGKFQLAYAPAKPGAVVDRWIDWDNVDADSALIPANGSPYIARIVHGLGAVTWVAQDATAPSVNGSWAGGWAHAWDVIFGWRNQTITQNTLATYMFAFKNNGDKLAGLKRDQLEKEWECRTRVDVGRVMLNGTDHTGKAGLYVTLAIFFFIGYWIVAGPGSFVFLAGKGRKQLSWTVFALTAMIATLLTVAVVKLVLRGDPEAKHFTVVRQAAGDEAVAISRIGLYIPRDGMQAITLPGVSPSAVSTLNALAVHPSHLADRGDGFLDTGKYFVDVRDDLSTDPKVEVDFPYRSTLKKLQAQRVGPLANGITGGPIMIVTPFEEPDPKDHQPDPLKRKKIKRGYIQGRLTNATGADLRNVFIAFRLDAKQDWMLYIPAWTDKQTIDVEAVFHSQAAADGDKLWSSLTMSEVPRRTRRGMLGKQWNDLFQGYNEGFGGSLTMGEGDVKEPNEVRPNLVVMSLFDRLSPRDNQESPPRTRVDVVRREGRDLNLSAALAAGGVVVLAEAKNVPLPFPLEVDHDVVAGTGSTFYQFVLPADRSKKDADEKANDAAERVKPKDGGEK